MKKNLKSIITNEMYKCLICGSYQNIKIHHIFDGCNKENSIKYGLIVPLCSYHYKPSSKLDLELKRLGQKAFEWKHKRDEFICIFGHNYLN